MLIHTMCPEKILCIHNAQQKQAYGVTSFPTNLKLDKDEFENFGGLEGGGVKI